MDLGKEQGIQVYTDPLSHEERENMKQLPHLYIRNHQGTGLLEIHEDQAACNVQASMGSERISDWNVTYFFPFFGKRLAHTRRKAAKRILSFYACQEEDTQA